MKKSNLFVLGFSLLLAFALAGTAWAKSAYIGAEHHQRQFDAWNINTDGTLTYQATYPFQHASDPSGIAIDAEVAAGENPVIFCTSEFSAGIEIVDPIDLDYMGVSTGPSNLAGIDVDDADNIVYALRRQTNDLYIYTWDPVSETLTQVTWINLPNMGYGYGIALDDSRDILWVSDTGNSMVRAYDVNVSNWSDIAEVPALSFSVSHPPIDVAVDWGYGSVTRNIVYTTGGWAGSYLLSKYDVETATETSRNTGARVIGCAVDNKSGYVYITRYCPADDLQVWDCSNSDPNLWTRLQDTEDVGNPAGICIPQEEVSYNPLNLSKDDGVVDCVNPGASITYELCFDNEKNANQVTNVTLTDVLPSETTYVTGSATGGGSHVAGTITWDVGTLQGGAAQTCYQFQAQVGSAVQPGSTITNSATIESTETGPTTINVDTDVCLEPVTPCCDLNGDDVCDIDDYYLFLGAYGSSPGDPRSALYP